jgi:hypothetical protein
VGKSTARTYSVISQMIPAYWLPSENCLVQTHKKRSLGLFYCTQTTEKGTRWNVFKQKELTIIYGPNKNLLRRRTDRFYRVLTMVYNTQNYWVFGLCPSSGF